MAESTSDIAAGVTATVSGPGTPNNVTVKKPATGVVWSIFLALLVVNVGVAAVIAVLAWPDPWPKDVSVALARIKGLSWIGWLLCADVVLLVFAIVSPWVGRVEASAGSNHVTLEGRRE